MIKKNRTKILFDTILFRFSMIVYFNELQLLRISTKLSHKVFASPFFFCLCPWNKIQIHVAIFIGTHKKKEKKSFIGIHFFECFDKYNKRYKLLQFTFVQMTKEKKKICAKLFQFQIHFIRNLNVYFLRFLPVHSLLFPNQNIKTLPFRMWTNSNYD